MTDSSATVVTGIAVLAGLSLLCAEARGQAPVPGSTMGSEVSASQIDWGAVREEATDLLSRYIRVNTANPPGNELAAARFLRDILIREGIEFLMLEGPDGKAALVGRLPAAERRAGSVILLNHMDVVAASREHWTVDPFRGLVRDGYVWGRGALDMKGEAIVELMSMILLRRHGPGLARDIVFLATSDEEIMGGSDAGTFVRRHRDLIRDAEFVINEGGTIRVDEDGRLQYYGVGVTEKSPFWHRVSARGPAGHGSQPIDSAAVHRLVRALERVRTWETELQVTPAVRGFFERLAEITPDEDLAVLYRDIESALADSVARVRILSNRYHEAILRNTISITALEGSPKTNVIPPIARAELDIRLLPGVEPGDFLTKLRDRIGAGGDSLVLEPLGTTWAATASPTDTELFRAIEATARELDPGAPVLPYVLAGFTDSHYFREIGIESYGVGLFRLPASESARVHGNDERISVENLGFGTRFLYELLVRLGT